ncbi:MAG: hypothetical protein ACKOLA_10055 [Spartobacteria bacterium]
MTTPVVPSGSPSVVRTRYRLAITTQPNQVAEVIPVEDSTQLKMDAIAQAWRNANPSQVRRPD